MEWEPGRTDRNSSNGGQEIGDGGGPSDGPEDDSIPSIS